VLLLLLERLNGLTQPLSIGERLESPLGRCLRLG
jgi:hypothetical protein